MTKKILFLLLAASLLLALAACGAAAPDGDAAPSKTENLSFAVVTEVYEDSYTAGDGTTLLREYYAVPYLELRTEAGKKYEPSASASNTAALLPPEVRVRDAFNAKMEEALAALRSESSEMAQSAKEYYDLIGESAGSFGCWANELRMESFRQTEGGLVSVLAKGYSYYGGAHPNTYTRSWNFDLSTGEFLTIDDLADPEGDLDGRSLAERVYWELSEQVREQELDKGYFDDYDSYLRDFSSFAVLNFTEDGLRVTFDPYIIAPYAAGEQVFTVPYSAFYNALNDRGRLLLDVPQEEIVLADYDAALTLWAWSFMTTPPTDNAPEQTTIDGYTYCSAAIPGISTLADMRALLCRYFDEALVDEWMNSEPPHRYEEVDGKLFVLSADRGSDLSIGDETFAVTLLEDGGVVTQTVCYQDYDAKSDTMKLTGETETFEYPFTLVDGHAVFSDFPCPL